MYKQLTIISFVSIFLILSACLKSEYNVDKGIFVKEHILASFKDNYYDICITDSFVIFLDNKSDTTLQIYKNNDFSKLYQIYNSGNNINLKFSHPQFSKSAILDLNTNSLLMVNNNSIYKILIASNENYNNISIVKDKSLMTLVSSTNYNITSKNIFGVPLLYNENKLFYSYNNGNYTWTKPDSVLPNYFSNISNVYLSNLCLNERANIIVSSLRFVNCITFTNMDIKKKISIIIGENIIPPKLDNRGNVDILNTNKYFIDMYATSRYVYCLYDGTNDYSSCSTILIFDWKGKHIKNIKTNSYIKKIAVDRTDSYIIALVKNKSNSQDIVKYMLP
ncbi:hypothetical protein AGMMS49574_29340 [Bacteroidia bacterium]|nr:hypothetical protein AGMMS49574_29340 [Bacteroidia bacterium]